MRRSTRNKPCDINIIFSKFLQICESAPLNTKLILSSIEGDVKHCPINATKRYRNRGTNTKMYFIEITNDIHKNINTKHI